MDLSVTHFGSGGQTPRSGAPRGALNGSFAPDAARQAPTRAARIARLSAGTVPGGVSFDAPPARTGQTLSLHAAPADRNTAATGVALGRTLDVTV